MKLFATLNSETQTLCFFALAFIEVFLSAYLVEGFLSQEGS